MDVLSCHFSILLTLAFEVMYIFYHRFKMHLEAGYKTI